MVRRLLVVLFLSVVPAVRGDCSGISWSYNSSASNGPTHWATLCSDWAVCGSGAMQSPINIDHSDATDSAQLHFSWQYNPNEQVTYINKGYTLEVEETAEGSSPSSTVTGAGLPGDFELKQFHLHAPSEHTLNGVQYPLEMHFVHSNPAKQYAVISVLFEAVRADASSSTTLAPLTNALSLISGSSSSNETSILVDPNVFLPSDRSFFKYNGSLTTPPCTEGVSWFVFRQPLQVSATQIAALDAVAAGALPTARPLQPMNSRTIVLVSPPGTVDVYMVVMIVFVVLFVLAAVALGIFVWLWWREKRRVLYRPVSGSVSMSPLPVVNADASQKA
eukprot:gnl/Spiro4/16245_TR8725_c0_g1_i1.p1 gnl/Spiro4/16245_TR8725_c0_g1~~gnl/Spiro4/16245_TR8725_c0_g1_i1.p1  ORF type:complete len:333 (+),score=80.85 gnl/Spiro4/16245_TR8725_c0_g1_i1:58-1056(+)